MSVLIRGMKMPKNCAECPLCEWSNHYKCYVCYNGHKISEIFIDGKYAAYADMIRIKRADNCPMTELTPHGRLIDADVTNKIYSLLKDLTSTEDYMGIGYNHGVVDSMTTIKNAPTIIGAEEVKE